MVDSPLVTFLTPIGPGHEKLAQRAGRSVETASGNAPEGAFRWECLVDKGEGRSATRNRLLEKVETTWLFWLDADDEVKADFWEVVSPHLEYDALWGVIETNREGIRPQQVAVQSLDDLLNNPILLCINIGYLIRTEVQRRYPWREDLDCCEDVDMYLRLWSDEGITCKKLSRPLYMNNRGQHSRGRRSQPGGVWTRRSREIQEQWKKNTSSAR